MSITDEVTKVVKVFKPIELATEIKNPVVNYQSPTNNFYFNSNLNSEELKQIAQIIAGRVVEEIRSLKDSK